MIALSLSIASGAAAQAVQGAGDARVDDALAASKAAIGNTLGDHRFAATDGTTIAVSDYLGKPLVISMIYTGCSGICPTVSEALANAVSAARATFGADGFNVVTVGFDVRNDTPQRMRSFARSHGISFDNWDFLSGDRRAVEGLAEDVGFRYFPSAQGFEHTTQTTVVDADGVVYRHVYGATFEPPHLVEPLKDLLYGRKGNMTSLDGIVNQVRLFCTIYDPATGRYRFDYSIFITIIVGGAALSGTAIIIVRAWWRQRRLQRHVHIS